MRIRILVFTVVPKRLNEKQTVVNSQFYPFVRRPGVYTALHVCCCMKAWLASRIPQTRQVYRVPALVPCLQHGALAESHLIHVEHNPSRYLAASHTDSLGIT